jgi:hypothetical protein
MSEILITADAKSVKVEVTLHPIPSLTSAKLRILEITGSKFG